MNENNEQTNEYTTNQENKEAFEHGQNMPEKQSDTRYNVGVVVAIAVIVMAAAGFYLVWF